MASSRDRMKDQERSETAKSALDARPAIQEATMHVTRRNGQLVHSRHYEREEKTASQLLQSMRAVSLCCSEMQQNHRREASATQPRSVAALCAESYRSTPRRRITLAGTQAGVSLDEPKEAKLGMSDVTKHHKPGSL